MSAADRAAATAAKFRPPTRDRAAAATEDAADLAAREELADNATRRETARTEPVRKTVDLAPAQYRQLRRWLEDAADETGQTRVTSQDALEALVKLLLTDETTSRKVLAHLKAWRGRR